MSDDDLDRERYRRLERPEPPTAPTPPGVARQVVQVFQETTLPTQVGRFFACHPVEISGDATEGVTPTVTPSTDVVYVDVIGPGVPKAGDLLVATASVYVWTAHKGGAPTPPKPKGRMCFDVAACEISPDSSIGAAIEVFSQPLINGPTTTVGTVTTSQNYPAQVCIDIPDTTVPLGIRITHSQYPTQIINRTGYAFPNAVQTLTPTGNPTSGTFTYSVPISGHSYVTTPITFSTVTATMITRIQAALDALLGTASTKVGAVGAPLIPPYTIQFQGVYAGLPITQGTVNATLNQGTIAVGTGNPGGLLKHLDLGNPTGYTCACTGVGAACPSARNTRPVGSPAGYAIPTTLTLNDGLGNVTIAQQPSGQFYGCAMRSATSIQPLLGSGGSVTVDVPVLYYLYCYGNGFQIAAYYPVGTGLTGSLPISGFTCSSTGTSWINSLPWLQGGLHFTPSPPFANGITEATNLRVCHPLSVTFKSPAIPEGTWTNIHQDVRTSGITSVVNPNTLDQWVLTAPIDLAQYIWGAGAQIWTLNV